MDDRASVAGALDHLVNQFSDPLSFLRELIQNSLDAGSREIEIRFELREGDGDLGTMIIHVDDFGEGMDREIIDTRLTRLFSSSKEGDLTKIGRFGIGFSSIFAIEPDAVCIDTSRGGESWRILFKKDRSFVRIERDEPVEGTKIQVIKAMTAAEFESTRKRAREVVSYWCKHVDAELSFDGELINEPFDLDLPIKVSMNVEGTEVVAGYTRDGSNFCGFYNKGLTLAEQSAIYYPKVAFKVSSRYLEHTLTRDNVIRDEHYDKAMAIIEDLVDGPLVERLFEELDASITGLEEQTSEETFLQVLVGWHITSELNLPTSTMQRAILRKVTGEPVTLAACLEAGKAQSKDRYGMILRASNPSPLSVALEEEGFLIADRARTSLSLLKALCQGEMVPMANEVYCTPVLATEPRERSAFEPLQRATLDLLRKAGLKVRELELGHFGFRDSGIGHWPAMSRGRGEQIIRRDEARQLGTTLLSKKRNLVVNAEHETVKMLMELAPKEPELAAHTLAKLFFLGHQLDTELETKLTTISMERRCRRLTR